jgi:hypothetical protein
MRDMERTMPKSATVLANDLLTSGAGGMEELRIHEFQDDESAHDDELIDRLYQAFSAELERVQVELTKKYGKPVRTGTEDDGSIPLNGVFRFAVWDIDGTVLYVAAAHEDRGVPILLMMGADSGNVA